MKKIEAYLRAEEWLSSKVTLMLGILLYIAYINNSKPEDTVRNFIAFFLYVSMFLAISYVANDFSDIEVDQKVGKKKIIASMPKWAIWASFATMAAIGNIYVVICARNKVLCLLLMAITYFSGLSYSIPGVRFKERGLLGLIECSFAQRCMPVVMIVCLEDVRGLSGCMLLAWMVLSFIDGLRYIIIHQLIDLDNDLASGVNTYVAGRRGNYKYALIAFFIVESIAVLALMAPLWRREPLVTGCFVFANVLLEYCIYMVLQKYAKKDIFATFDSVPLEAFLNVFFPLLAAVCLAIVYPVLSVLILVLILFCAKPFMVKVRIAEVYVKSKVR